jgi:hypothetical protein
MAVYDLRGLSAKDWAESFAKLERLATHAGLLIRQRPDQPGVYETSPGQAFHACVPVALPEECAKRERAHQAAVRGTR